jgi:hypothetical protein
MVVVTQLELRIKNLLLFIDEHPETVRGIFVHCGNAIRWLYSKVIAVPWWWLHCPSSFYLKK